MFSERLRDLGYVMDYAWLPDEKDKCDPYCRPEVLDKYCGFVFYGGYNNHPVLRYVIENDAPYVHLVPGSRSPYHTVTCPRAFPTICRSLEYFAERGHELADVVKITSPFETPDDIEMLQAKARSLEMRVRLHRVSDCPRKSDYIRLGSQLTASLLNNAEGELPGALCVTDDVIARGVAIRLLNHGIDRLPNLDLLVIGRLDEIMHLGLPVTPMVWDTRSAVMRGATMLHEQLVGDDPHPRSIIFPYEFCSLQEESTTRVQMETIELA